MFTQQLFLNASPVAQPSQPPSQQQKCNTICTLQYKPICAGPTNGMGLNIDFSNECYLNQYNCQNPKNRKYLLINILVSFKILIIFNFYRIQGIIKRMVHLAMKKIIYLYQILSTYINCSIKMII